MWSRLIIKTMGGKIFSKKINWIFPGNFTTGFD